MALLKAFGYWLQRYELNFSSPGRGDGASYTDVKAQLPALNMLIVISVAAALLFFVNIRLRGWVLPVIAVGLWAFVSVVIGAIYPAVIQQFQVEPNELQKESKYIERNIDATRAAFGLDTGEQGLRLQGGPRRRRHPGQRARPSATSACGTRTCSRRPTPQHPAGPAALHVRRRRHRPLPVDGETRQVVLSARELEPRQPPQQDLAEPAPRLHPRLRARGLAGQRGDPDGRPAVSWSRTSRRVSTELEVTPARHLLRRGAPRATPSSTPTRRSSTSRREPQDAATTYAGKGGVPGRQLLRRAAFFLRFGDLKVLISGQITSRVAGAVPPRHPGPGRARRPRSSSSTPTPTRCCSTGGSCG